MRKQKCSVISIETIQIRFSNFEFLTLLIFLMVVSYDANLNSEWEKKIEIE